MLSAIKNGLFIPDATRSGLFRQAAAPQAEGETDLGQGGVALSPDSLHSEAEARHRQAVTPNALHSLWQYLTPRQRVALLLVSWDLRDQVVPQLLVLACPSGRASQSCQEGQSLG